MRLHAVLVHVLVGLICTGVAHQTPDAARSPTARRLLGQTEPTQKFCDELPFLPALCWHKLRAPARFPVKTQYAYATLCDYPVLSLGNKETRQCAILAVSLLFTIPKHGFIMLVPHATVIEADYLGLLEAMRVRIERYDNIDVPEAAKKSAEAIGRSTWIPSYQKLNLWRLRDAWKVLYIDCDSVVLRNLDHVFLQPDSIGCDCMLHYKGFSEEWVGGYGIGGLLLATPAPETFQRLVTALNDGFDNATQTWRYEGGDQVLIRENLDLKLLPANMQFMVEVCQRSRDPMLNFPLDNMMLVHFAGLPKGYEMQLRVPSDPESMCNNQFVLLYDYFDYEVTAALQYHRLHQRGSRLRLASARAAGAD